MPGKKRGSSLNFFHSLPFPSPLSPSPRIGLARVSRPAGEQRVERGLSEPSHGAAAAAAAAGSREGSGPDVGATRGMAMAC